MFSIAKETALNKQRGKPCVPLGVGGGPVHIKGGGGGTEGLHMWLRPLAPMSKLPGGHWQDIGVSLQQQWPQFAVCSLSQIGFSRINTNKNIWKIYLFIDFIDFVEIYEYEYFQIQLSRLVQIIICFGYQKRQLLKQNCIFRGKF